VRDFRSRRRLSIAEIPGVAGYLAIRIDGFGTVEAYALPRRADMIDPSVGDWRFIYDDGQFIGGLIGGSPGIIGYGKRDLIRSRKSIEMKRRGARTATSIPKIPEIVDERTVFVTRNCPIQLHLTGSCDYILARHGNCGELTMIVNVSSALSDVEVELS